MKPKAIAAIVELIGIIPRNPCRNLAIAAVFFLIAGSIGTWAILEHIRESTLTEYENELRQVDLLLAKDTSRIFQGIDITLNRAADLIGKSGRLSADVLADKFSFLNVLSSILPSVRRISVVDDRGFFTGWSADTPIPTINVSDRDYFAHFRDSTAEGLFVSAPSISRIDHLWTIFLSRRIETEDGHFAGVVVASVELRYFEALFKSMMVDEGRNFTLLNSDFVLLARHPWAESMIGKSLKNVPATRGMFSDGQRASSGRFKSGIDGQERIVAARFLEDYPFIVSCSIKEGYALVNWHKYSFNVWLYAGIGAIIFLAFLVLLGHQLIRRQAYQAALEAREAGERQREKMVALGTLTSGIAHELNNILHPILNFIKLGRRLWPTDPVQAEQCLETAQRSVIKAGALVHRILAFGRREVNPHAPTPFGPAFLDAMTLVRTNIPPSITLSVEVPDCPDPVPLSPAEVTTVVTNLVLNAVQAMGETGQLTITGRILDLVTPIVRRSVIGPGRFLELAFSDTGTGIPTEIRDRIFEPFFTTRETGVGCGLGLFVLDGILTRIHGGILVADPPAPGATLAVYLPLIQSPREDAGN